ncbi:MAG: hypothetical protein XD95_0002 [Microgenomates bacterium 39_7]|nr:MAG: hypothetical protein XD95_0002 [Microgenomates bacterium 39_7]
MFSQLPKRSRALSAIYLVLLGLYAFFSYGLTAPNLILINANWFLAFQNRMWTEFFNQRDFLAVFYLVSILILFITYLLLVRSLPKDKKINPKQQFILILFFSLPLLISYNSLSFDVFNYIFNSRMVLDYQANPHVRTAIEFSQFDDWTRFMHNIHTPAPYGYGWTVLSLIPYLAGFGKFLVTWLNFRVLSIVSLVFSSFAVNKLNQSLYNKNLSLKRWLMLFLNPLVLIEVVSNSHNDLWMMFPAIYALIFLLEAVKNQKQRKIFLCFVAWLMFFLSVSIKFATLALLPIMILLTIFALNSFAKKSKIKILFKMTRQFIKNNLPLISSVLMFLPLFTSRSQRFHPWYLLWPLIWLPLIKNKVYVTLLLVFSFTSLVRYYPWLKMNDYSQQILVTQRYITWSAIAITMILTGLSSIRKKVNA